MIEHLDNLLRHLFLDEVARLQSESQQIWFQPPDDEWRSHPSDLALDRQPANACTSWATPSKPYRRQDNGC